MKQGLFTFLIIIASLSLHAQSDNLWSRVDLSVAAKGKNIFEKTYQPSQYVSFQLNENAIRALLSKAPSENNVSANNSSFIITVPNSQGQLERYKLVEASVMQDGLQAKHPDIRSYAGRGIDKPTSYIRCDMSPDGFHAMIISSERNTIYINPVDKESKSYIVFDRNHLSDNNEVFDCKTEAVANTAKQLMSSSTSKNANDGKLRIYRFAVTTGGEFSKLIYTNTGTDAQKKAQVLAALVTDLTRVNGIFEADFGIRLDLINNEDTIIYLDGATDPYTSDSTAIPFWGNQCQSTLSKVIGPANYDIGHLLMGYATGGNAGCIGCVCNNNPDPSIQNQPKGSAVTGYITNLTSDPFIVDYWCHEIGHQFGAYHTFYDGAVGIYSGYVQMEPNKGITIMSYGNIGTQHKLPDFHSASIQQVTNYIQIGFGNTCGTVFSTGDSIPVVNAGADYTIPKSTPFALTATGKDADKADSLTYSWEQYDTYTSRSSIYPNSTDTAGPEFRCFSPTTNPVRTFPILSGILNGSNASSAEVLPSVARKLNFRVTVRDNKPGGGSNNSDDMVVTVAGTSGPFTVTSPNTVVTYNKSSKQTIKWSVASTNIAPVSCTNVAILLSTDGGNSFPYTLLASTPNTGSASVTIPNVSSTTARIKVAAVGNIFFDISNTNFTISCITPTGLASGSVTGTSAKLSWSAVSGVTSYAVDYKIHSATTWTSAATATTATSVTVNGLTPETLYDWRVKTTCPSAYATAQFTTATCNSQYDAGTHNDFTTAVSIPFNTAVNGKISTIQESDYYKFVISKSGTATITLTNLPADYNLYLYDVSKTLIGLSTNQATISETISGTYAAGTYYIIVVPNNYAFNDAVCYVLKVTTGTASKTADFSTANVLPALFPNPAHSILTVKNPKLAEGSTIKITDMYGRSVIEKQASASTQQIDISRLAAGVYMLSIINKDETITALKFVKE